MNPSQTMIDIEETIDEENTENGYLIDYRDLIVSYLTVESNTILKMKLKLDDRYWLR